MKVFDNFAKHDRIVVSEVSPPGFLRLRKIEIEAVIGAKRCFLIFGKAQPIDAGRTSGAAPQARGRQDDKRAPLRP